MNVLVVETEERVRHVAVGALRLAGHEVAEVAHGRGALRLARRSPRAWDVIVLDVALPDIDGFDVCRQLRADGDDTPILFLTARAATEDRLRGLTISGDDYLVKPFSVEELVARVGVILRRTGKVAGPQTLAAGKIELDDEAHVVRLAGDELALSPTEYNLLRYLMVNRGRALTRAQILDHVWDYEFLGDPTIVEVFVSSLRRKLHPEGRLIHTVRGVGYRLG